MLKIEVDEIGKVTISGRGKLKTNLCDVIAVMSCCAISLSKKLNESPETTLFQLYQLSAKLLSESECEEV